MSAVTTGPAAGPSTGPRDFSGKPGPRARHQANQKKYGTPLPILLPSSPLHPDYVQPKEHKSTSLTSFLSSLIPRLGPTVIVPECRGVYDPVTRSVWVEKREDMEILFQRGFFGKGTLSRSEPTWRQRRLDILKGGESLAAEKIREKRRLERKQFKIDRAQAMLDAAKAAEAVITSGASPLPQLVSGPSVLGTGAGAGEDGEDEGDEEGDMDGSASPAPTTSSIVDVSTLTPQTFLVRPTRPDSNRNRGRNAFKRKPKPKPVDSPQGQTESTGASVPTGVAASIVAVPPPAPAPAEVPDEEDEEEEEGFDEDIVEDMEHLQLGLEEAWFLSAGLGVLRIYDPRIGAYLPNSFILPRFISPTLIDPTPSRLFPDDPFLVSYVCYHHFRSLGWVVKPGVKFSSDWLLYRKGPVFSHAAFSIVMIPVYTDQADRDTSPYGHEDWYEERLSWKWMNTIMRVNSLVQKTVIIVYITIPSLDSIDAFHKLENGSLDPRRNDMKSLLSRYSIKEVSLQRFGPARRRD